MHSQSRFEKQFALNQKAQGQVEYTVLVLLVTMVFWLGVRDTGIGENLQTAWKEVGGSIFPVGGGSAGKPGEGSGGGAGGGAGSGGSVGGSGAGSGGSFGAASGGGSGSVSDDSSGATSGRGSSSGDVSGGGSGGGSFLGAASKDKNSGTASSAGNSTSEMKFSYLGIWLSLLLVMLTLTPVAIWTVIKASRKNDEAAGNNEIPYQKLDTQEITVFC